MIRAIIKATSMSSQVKMALIPLIGVVIGALLTFFSQFILGFQAERRMRIDKAITVKNDQCIKLWEEFANIYQYLYFTGGYSPEKIDVEGLSQHINKLNIAIIRAEPYISHKSFLKLMEIRDQLNEFYIDWAKKHLSYKEYMKFIEDLEQPMNIARDILHQELSLSELKVFRDE